MVYKMVEPIDKHARRRQQSIERLQEAALKVLAGKNYSAIRVEDITEEAGMAKGSLYMYFKSKDDLYVKMIKKCFLDEIGKSVDQFFAIQDSREALRWLVDLHFEPGFEFQYLDVFYRAVMDKSLLELIRPDLEEFIDRFLKLMERHFTAIGTENPSQRAYAMFVLLDALFNYRFLKLGGNWHWESARAMERLKSEVLRLLDLE